MKDTPSTSPTTATSGSSPASTAAERMPAPSKAIAQPSTTGRDPSQQTTVVTDQKAPDRQPDISAEEVGYRPPDHAPSPDAPESENAGLIFERS